VTSCLAGITMSGNTSAVIVAPSHFAHFGSSLDVFGRNARESKSVKCIKCEIGPYGRLWGWWLCRVSLVPRSMALQSRLLNCAMQSGLPLSPSYHPVLPETKKTRLGSLLVDRLRDALGLKLCLGPGSKISVRHISGETKRFRAGSVWDRSVFTSS
jgi:hypothetical protein